ncbi:MAG: hypothetical protein ACAH17_01805 [Candidatus Paceibacterota bacterium]
MIPFKGISVLTTRDELEFSNAAILVASNQERSNLNLYMAKRFAVQSGQPILRWRKTISQQPSQMLTVSDIDKLYDSDETQVSFIVPLSDMH